MQIKNITQTDTREIKKKRVKTFELFENNQPITYALSKEKSSTAFIKLNRKSAKYTKQNEIRIPTESEEVYLGLI